MEFAMSNPFRGSRFTPFFNYKLPSLKPVDGSRIGGAAGTDKKFYRLVWPGEMDEDVVVPIPLLKELLAQQGYEDSFKHKDPSSRLLEKLLKEFLIPLDAPLSLAYHMAVNVERYGLPEGHFPRTPRSVGGLSGASVDYVLGARFALDGKAMATAVYLRWMAESHRYHPLLRTPDKVRREGLHHIIEEIVYRYFWCLSLNLYDPVRGKWRDDPIKWEWPHLACYLHWVGRVKPGRVLRLSRMDPMPQWLKARENTEVGLTVKLHQVRFGPSSMSREEKLKRKAGSS